MCVEYWVVLADHILNVPCLLVTMDVYFVFSKICSMCNKAATTL